MGDVAIGARLRKAREAKNLKQADVLEKLGIAKVQSLSAYEKGTSNPTLETLKKMAELYEVTTDELLFGEKRDFHEKDYYRKKDKVYFLELVSAVDALNLPLVPMDEDDLPSYGIDLSYFYHLDKVQFFIHSWKKYKELLAQNIIDELEYSALLLRKIEELEDHDFCQTKDPYCL